MYYLRSDEVFRALSLSLCCTHLHPPPPRVFTRRVFDALLPWQQQHKEYSACARVRWQYKIKTNSVRLRWRSLNAQLTLTQCALARELRRFTALLNVMWSSFNACARTLLLADV